MSQSRSSAAPLIRRLTLKVISSSALVLAVSLLSAPVATDASAQGFGLQGMTSGGSHLNRGRVPLQRRPGEKVFGTKVPGGRVIHPNGSRGRQVGGRVIVRASSPDSAVGHRRWHRHSQPERAVECPASPAPETHSAPSEPKRVVATDRRSQLCAGRSRGRARGEHLGPGGGSPGSTFPPDAPELVHLPACRHQALSMANFRSAGPCLPWFGRLKPTAAPYRLRRTTSCT